MFAARGDEIVDVCHCPAGDLQGKPAERGRNFCHDCPRHPSKPSSRACAAASDPRKRRIPPRDPCAPYADVGIRACCRLGRTVFVRQFAPHHALGAARVSGIVADAAKRADQGRVHSYRLRHTAATELWLADASLPEIGQILRHRRTETTATRHLLLQRDGIALPEPWFGSDRGLDGDDPVAKSVAASG